MQDFKKLSVWQKAHSLTLEVYKITSKFPKEEVYGLSSQIRRACSSIPTNIAEGCGRKGSTELSRFLQIAFGSACELEYHLILSADLGYLKTKEYEKTTNQLSDVKKMLSGFIQKLNTEN
jgi:four helix bundle protein